MSAAQACELRERFTCNLNSVCAMREVCIEFDEALFAFAVLNDQPASMQWSEAILRRSGWNVKCEAM